MEKAVSELGLDRWSRICSCRERKNLPVEGDGIEFVHFSNRVLWRALFVPGIAKHWVRLQFWGTKTQTLSFATS